MAGNDRSGMSRFEVALLLVAQVVFYFFVFVGAIALGKWAWGLF